MLAPSATRVEEQTPEHVNEKIRRQTEMNIAFFTANPDQIAHRLEELEQEWDIERAIEANAATLAVVGTVFGIVKGRHWFLLPGVVGGFLLQHAIQGWCPPVSILRRMGFRTRHEIDTEYFALKALRGDFKDVSETPEKLSDAKGALEAARK